MKLPATADRVSSSTPAYVNEQIRHETADRIHLYADQPEEIDDRLAELDAEWDIERYALRAIQDGL